ncbi:MAG TPA: molybdate ABC transporter permease subunit [Candidatus Deferrimicrobium sp.]|nr:molybdate ABC transporter permease subunit [Candidatus Deferrimicrobium sp.]
MQFDFSPIILSLKVAVASIIIVVCFCVPIAGLMAKHEFWGKDIVESLITLPLVLPPSVVGFTLLYLFGKNGPLGRLLEQYFHYQVVFSLSGAVIAAVVVSFPLMYQSLKAAIESVDVDLEKAARTLGAGELRVFFTITLPLAWNGFIAGLVLAFARSLGEFGATLMIAGNIPGRTQTMPLAIYLASDAGETQTASVLVVIMTLFSFLVIYGLNRWRKKSVRNLLGAASND